MIRETEIRFRLHVHDEFVCFVSCINKNIFKFQLFSFMIRVVHVENLLKWKIDYYFALKWAKCEIVSIIMLNEFRNSVLQRIFIFQNDQQDV